MSTSPGKGLNNTGELCDRAFSRSLSISGYIGASPSLEVHDTLCRSQLGENCPFSSTQVSQLARKSPRRPEKANDRSAPEEFPYPAEFQECSWIWPWGG